MTLTEMRRDFVKQGNYFEFVGKISDEMINNYEFYDDFFIETNRLSTIEALGYLSDFDTEWKDLLNDSWIEYCNKYQKLKGEQL